MRKITFDKKHKMHENLREIKTPKFYLTQFIFFYSLNSSHNGYLFYLFYLFNLGLSCMHNIIKFALKKMPQSSVAALPRSMMLSRQSDENNACAQFIVVNSSDILESVGANDLVIIANRSSFCR